ncbi:hypothetical protein ACJIZ3_019032 [Penstemon smallii]|uniref:DCD domain-containing protein n=1 Tax=Penstemon smallii TaxID=265156 RepID=A0ABD3T0X8_9LAMI
MEAGWKPQTFNPSENSSPWMASSVPWARNLKKNQLGGVIFGCTNDTLKECHSNQLFGLPGQHFSYVKNIEPGLPLFLFNYSERKLHGIYEAVSSGKMNIDSYAWTAGGLDRTRYPAQVQIRSRLQCQALTEIQFKPIIVDNYYSQSHFWFELDHAQASKLISKLSSLAVAPGPFVPKHIPKRTTETQWFPSDNKSRDYEKPTANFAKSHDSVGTFATSDGSNEVVESPLRGKVVENDEVGLMFEKLKELARSRGYADANLVGNSVEVESKDEVDLEQDTHDIALRKANGENSFDINDYPTIIAKLCHEVEELNSFKQEQTRKMKSLEMKLVNFQ